MEIQRVKFLLLASALAGPACVTTVTDEHAGNSDASTGGSKGTGGKSGGTGGKSGATGTGGAATGGRSATGGVSNADGSVGGSAATDGSAGGADGSAGGADGSTGGADAGTGGGATDGAVHPDANQPDGACNDNAITGGFGDCTTLPSSCGIVSFMTDECNGAKTLMKPFIAQQAIACILNKASTCDATDTYNCVDQTLKIACPDTTADDECAHINTLCSVGDAGIDLCKTYLSGMTQLGRDNMVSCMELSCSPGLYSCLESLRP